MFYSGLKLNFCLVLEKIVLIVSGMDEIPKEINVNVSVRNAAVYYRVQWNCGSWVILTVIFVIAVVYLCFQAKELLQIKDCEKKLTNEAAPMYTVFGVLTN